MANRGSRRNPSSRVKSRPASGVGRLTKARSRGVATARIGGQRLGTKKRDMRWQDPDGTVWASKFEYEVFATLREKGYAVTKTSPEDSLPYASDVKQGRCLECGSKRVVQERSYTPDLFVHTSPSAGGGVQDSGRIRTGYYIEAKGYLRADRRKLLRCFRKANPDVDLRLVAQRDYKVGKGTLSSWAVKYLKVPVHIWNGGLPNDW